MLAHIIEDDLAIPDPVQIGVAFAAPQHFDVIAAAIALDRNMQRLVDIAEPMAEEFQRVEPFGIGAGTIEKNAGMQADRLGDAAILGAVFRINMRIIAALIDIVPGRRFGMGAAAHLVGPGTGIAEILELRVERDQAVNLGAGLIAEIAIGEIANDAVTFGAIGLRRSDTQQASRQAAGYENTEK